MKGKKNYNTGGLRRRASAVPVLRAGVSSRYCTQLEWGEVEKGRVSIDITK